AAPTIVVHDGEDEDQIIKEMEARGEIPPPGVLPAGQIRIIVHRIISPPNGEPNWERYHTERYQAALAGSTVSQACGATPSAAIDRCSETSKSPWILIPVSALPSAGKPAEQTTIHGFSANAM